MTYLDALNASSRRRGSRRAGAAESSRSSPTICMRTRTPQLGAPRELARQFADELGTRLARTAAFRVFAALAFAGIALGVMFVAVGRMRGLTIEGGTHTATPSWASPILLLAALTAQVALAAGGLALLRGWRLRREASISRADATILARRSALGLLSGAGPCAALPAAALAFGHEARSDVDRLPWIIAAVGLAALATAVPAVLAGFGRVPDRRPASGDLIDDLGPWVPTLLDAGALCAAAGAGDHGRGDRGRRCDRDPYDGALRGITDGPPAWPALAILGATSACAPQVPEGSLRGDECRRRSRSHRTTSP